MREAAVATAVAAAQRNVVKEGASHSVNCTFNVIGSHAPRQKRTAAPGVVGPAAGLQAYDWEYILPLAKCTVVELLAHLYASLQDLP